MAVYTIATSSAQSWILRDGTITSVTSTLVIIANNDGTETRLIGTNFAGDTSSLTDGTITEIDRTPGGGGAPLETITGISYPAITFSGHLTTDLDFRNIFTDILNGVDTVTGANSNNGTDFLVGGSGGDALDGQAGFDFADYINAGSGVTANLANSGLNTGDAAGDTYTAIEAIRGSDFADVLTGDSQSNFLRGGLGADTLDGGTGFDYADYAPTTNIIVSLANPAANTGEAVGDTFTSIEGIATGAGNDTLIGDASGNFLRGRGGADQLNGGGGIDYADYQGATIGVTASLANPGVNTGDAAGDTYISIEGIRGTVQADVLSGDAQDNYLRGGGGGDQLNGGNGFDFASYGNSGIGLTVDLQTPGNNTGEAIGDTYTSIEGLEGSDLGDNLFGDANNNYLRGRQGADALDGRGGLDVASYATSSAGLTVNLGNPGANTGEAAGDTYTSIEGLAGSDQGDNLTGDVGDNLLRGNGGADQLFGGAGGIDTADYGAADNGLILDLAAPANNTGEAVGDTYGSIEGLTGSDFNDIMRGDNGNNVLNGGSGNDVITGGNGNDVINGGANSDIAFLRGNRSDYTITLLSGVYTIVDSVAGRDGTDTLTGVETVIFADGAVAVASLPGTPVISSNGGGATASITIPENNSAVATVVATQLDPTPALTYSISGGADAALFQINSSTGALSFVAAPNFESPSDVGLDNIYNVTVRSSDGTLFDDQAIAVTVVNAEEPPTSLFDENPNSVSLATSGAWSALGGSDTVVGSSGADLVDGGDGYDNLYGGAGADTLFGGALEDIVVGDAGADVLFGGDGGDVLSELFDPVNSGNDIIDGGNGIDIIYAAAGDDLVIGGTDTANNYGNLGDGNDTYQGSGGTDVVVAGAGNDTVSGNTGDDSLYGEDGDDVINGGTGIDLLSGSNGNDNLDGGAGNDLLIGDAGLDILRGGAGIDVLFGFAGDDLLNGGAGGDVDALYGGSGNDTFQVGGTNFGTDYVYDWTVNTTPGASDQLVFQAGHFASVAAVRAAATFSSGNTTIAVPSSGGASVVIVGVNITNILDEDIIISGAF